MTTIDDLMSLPAPAVVEPLSFETILGEMLGDFQRRYPDYSALIASDPAMKLLEVAAYRELILRHRINAAARGQLLAFAVGSDLDHLAAFYGVERLPNEADDRLRERVRARISGWANAGGAAHYRHWALSASTDVRDAAVVSPAPGVVEICVLVRDGADVAVTLDAVRAVVMRDDVRVLTDTVRVVDAQMLPVTVRARLWRLPAALPGLAEAVSRVVAAEIRDSVRLGWDLTRSWIIAHLHRAGVHRVELIEPHTDVRVAPHQAVRLVAIEIEEAGIDE